MQSMPEIQEKKEFVCTNSMREQLTHSDLSEIQRKTIMDMVDEYQDTFMTEGKSLRRTKD